MAIKTWIVTLRFKYDASPVVFGPYSTQEILDADGDFDGAGARLRLEYPEATSIMWSTCTRPESHSRDVILGLLALRGV